MVRLVPAVLCTILVCVTAALARDEQIDSKLTTAKQTFEKDVAAARSGLIEALKDKEVEAQKKGNLQLLERVRAEKEAFEANDQLPVSVATRGYTDGLRKAQQRLEDAYVAARKAYTRAGDIDEAKNVDQELRELKDKGLPGISSEVTSDGKSSINLLKLIDPQLDSVRGQWRREGEGIVSPDPYSDEGRLGIPIFPDGDYDLVVKFVRLKGPNGPGITLPVGSHQVVFVIDGGKDQFAALQKLDGHFFFDQSNPTRIGGVHVVSNREHTITAHVRAKDIEPVRIQVEFDGKRVVDWTGSPSQLAMDPNWQMPDSRILGLHAWGTVYRFDTIQLTMLTGIAKRPWGNPIHAR